MITITYDLQFVIPINISLQRTNGGAQFRRQGFSRSLSDSWQAGANQFAGNVNGFWKGFLLHGLPGLGIYYAAFPHELTHTGPFFDLGFITEPQLISVFLDLHWVFIGLSFRIYITFILISIYFFVYLKYSIVGNTYFKGFTAYCRETDIVFSFYDGKKSPRHREKVT